MALIYITGVAGTGKSTIRLHLESLGYKAYDADLDGITGWRHIATGTFVSGHDMPGYLSQQWFEEYEWSLNRVRVAQIAAEAEHETVFLCGTSANDEEIHDLLHHVMFLSIDEATLRYRLANRDTNSFGKSEEELNHVLRWLKPAEEYYRNFGAVILDAAAPLEHVVGQILSFTHPDQDYISA
jgi:shikimate kinase